MEKKQRLIYYAEQSLIMNVKIKLENETFTFNLDSELRIVEAKKDKQMLDHPRAYGFLKMLYAKVSAKAKDCTIISKKTKSNRLFKLRQDMLVKEAELKIDEDKEYLSTLREQHRWENYKEEIGGCISSYEVRKDLLQTLSANERDKD